MNKTENQLKMDYLSSILPPLRPPTYHLPAAHIYGIREPRRNNRNLYISTAAFISTAMPVFNAYVPPPQQYQQQPPIVPKQVEVDPTPGLFGIVSRFFSGIKKTVEDVVGTKKVVPDLPNPEVLDIAKFLTEHVETPEEEFSMVERPLWQTEPLPCDRLEMSPPKSPKRIKSSPKKSPFSSHHHHTKPMKNRGAKVRHELFSDIKESVDIDEVDCAFEKVEALAPLNTIMETDEAAAQHIKHDFILMNENFPQLPVISPPKPKKNEAFVIYGMEMVKYTPSINPVSPLRQLIGRLSCRSRNRTISEQSDDGIVFFDSDAQTCYEDSDAEDCCSDDDYDDDDSDVEESETEEEDNETDTSDSDDDDDAKNDDVTFERKSQQVEPQLDSGFEEEEKGDRKEKRVRFDDTPKVFIMRTHLFAALQARKGQWREWLLDKERYTKRTREIEKLLQDDKIFDPEHRARIYASRFAE